MSEEAQPLVIHYEGVEYANLGEIPFPTVGFGDLLKFEFELENRSSNSLGEMSFESNIKPLIDSQTNVVIQPFIPDLPTDMGPFAKGVKASITIDGTALYKLDSSIRAIAMGIKYTEMRIFR